MTWSVKDINKFKQHPLNCFFYALFIYIFLYTCRPKLPFFNYFLITIPDFRFLTPKDQSGTDKLDSCGFYTPIGEQANASFTTCKCVVVWALEYLFCTINEVKQR